MENMEEISQIVAEEIGNKQHKRKVRTDTLVYKLFGKQYNELTKEEQREYWVAKHKRDMQDEEKLVAKREYERERYKRRLMASQSSANSSQKEVYTCQKE